MLAKVAGLNIWESDGAGLQLGIGARGLSPNRSSHFNLRQNGYDIAADALGYPESYYTPPAEALERIEFVRGAASLQYGTQFGGMVNFKLKAAPDSGLAINSRLTAGSFGFHGLFTQIGYRSGRQEVSGFVHYVGGQGWRPHSDFESLTAYAQYGWWSKNSKLYQKLEFTHKNYLAQQPGGLTDFQFAENPRQANRPRNWFTIDWNLAAHHLNWTISPRTQFNARTFGLYARRAAVGNLERINVADAVVGKRTLIDGYYRNIGHESRLMHRIGLSHLLVGVRLYQGTTTARQGDASAAGDPDFSLINPDRPEGSDYLFPNTNAALFTEYLWQINKRWSMTAGMRAEYIRTLSQGHYRRRVFDFAGNLVVDDRVDESSQRARSLLLFGLGLSYKPHESAEWYVNIAQNYRAINFSDLRIVNPNFRVDPNLQDEKGYTADWGYRGRLTPWLVADGSLFLLWYNNKIGQILQTDQPPLFLDYRLRTNVAAARSLGAELLLEAQLAQKFLASRQQGLTIYINSAYTHARYLRSTLPGINGKQLEQVPPFILRSGLQYRWKKFRAGSQFSWVTSHYSDATNAERTATAVEGRIPAYGVADISLRYQYKAWSLEGSINNLFDAAYFTRRAEAYPGPGIIPADGRSFYLTLAYQFWSKKP
jgi:Fe(3+) dicitrate transport protein